MLASKLAAAGAQPPDDVLVIEDPVARFRALDRVRTRAGLHHLGAPWEEVLRRLGVQMGPDVARQLVRAFATLPGTSAPRWTRPASPLPPASNSSASIGARTRPHGSCGRRSGGVETPARSARRCGPGSVHEDQHLASGAGGTDPVAEVDHLVGKRFDAEMAGERWPAEGGRPRLRRGRR